MGFIGFGAGYNIMGSGLGRFRGLGGLGAQGFALDQLRHSYRIMFSHGAKLDYSVGEMM